MFKINCEKGCQTPEFSLVDEKTIFSDTRQDGFYMAKLVRK